MSEAQHNKLAHHLATKKDKLYGGYKMASDGKVQMPAQPYQRQRSLKSVLHDRLQQGLTTDVQSLHKAAAWSCKDL